MAVYLILPRQLSIYDVSLETKIEGMCDIILLGNVNIAIIIFKEYMGCL